VAWISRVVHITLLATLLCGKEIVTASTDAAPSAALAPRSADAMAGECGLVPSQKRICSGRAESVRSGIQDGGPAVTSVSRTAGAATISFRVGIHQDARSPRRAGLKTRRISSVRR
jgi:hypothetical protein